MSYFVLLSLLYYSTVSLNRLSTSVGKDFPIFCYRSLVILLFLIQGVSTGCLSMF